MAEDEKKDETQDVTTPQNVARTIDDALAQPRPDPRTEISKYDAEKKPIVDEVATAIGDPFWAYYTGKILLNPDKTLRTQGSINNTDIFEDLLRDDTVLSNMQTRRLAVTGKEWTITPASEKRQDVKIAEFVKRVLLDFDFDRARYNLLEAILVGFKVSEIMWEPRGDEIWIGEMIAKPSRRFTFGLKRELRLITRSNMFEGFPVPERKFQVFTYGGNNGSPYGDGLGSALYWPVWFKKNTIKFWMIFSEKFGSPTAIGKYPAGTPKEQQDALLGALDAIQQETAIKIPDTMQISFLEASRTMSQNNYESLSQFMNAAVTKIIMGQTLTTELAGKGGSFAASKTHEEVRQDYILADGKALDEALNGQVIRWLVDYNFGSQKAYPKIHTQVQDSPELLSRAQRDQILQMMGIKFPRSYFTRTYGVPEPEAGEEVVKAVTGAKAAINPGRNVQSEINAEMSECGCGHEYADLPSAKDMADDMAAAMPAEKLTAASLKMLTPALKVIRREKDYGKAIKALAGAYPKMDDTALQELLARAIFVSNLIGRIEAENGGH